MPEARLDEGLLTPPELTVAGKQALSEDWLQLQDLSGAAVRRAIAHKHVFDVVWVTEQKDASARNA